MRDLAAGEPCVLPGGIRPGVVCEPVAKGHKMAITEIAAGEAILKYGQHIGTARVAIAPGQHVHVHNLAMSEARGATPEPAPRAVTAPAPARSFMGFCRDGRRAGTRNYVAIATSVNCSATVVHAIAETVRTNGMLAAYPQVDGVVALSHQSGCAMARSGESYETLRRTIQGAITNPNFAGALVVGLGCEVVQAGALLADAGLAGHPAYRAITIQESGGTQAAIAAGIAALEPILAFADAARREECPVADLVLGLQCGGSDGWSGISSNPALGNAVDRLVAQGGTALLSETPEIIGAEHLLLARAVSPQVADQLRERIEWWRAYAATHGVSLDNNPSPGNLAGGLTTILEKSLGAVAKGGTSPLAGVIRYAQPPGMPGLVFMDSPGFDPCSATGQIASGATLIAFTTERGSAFGAQPTPSLRLSSNSHC